MIINTLAHKEFCFNLSSEAHVVLCKQSIMRERIINFIEPCIALSVNMFSDTEPLVCNTRVVTCKLDSRSDTKRVVVELVHQV